MSPVEGRRWPGLYLHQNPGDQRSPDPFVAPILHTIPVQLLAAAASVTA